MNYSSSFIAKVNAKRKVTVHLEFNADDWQLYGGDGFDVSRDNVAHNLNTVISFCINKAANSAEAWALINDCIRPFAKYGAADSEGYALLEKIVTFCFSEE
jgi:hypothetical protein